MIRFYESAGDYRFLVALGFRCRPVTPVIRYVSVLPFYWQTQWFRALMIAAAVIAVAIVARFGIRRRLARQELLLRQQEERARLEAELQQTRRAEVIGRLAGGIAHDFNNILAAVLGNAELASRLDVGKLLGDLRDLLFRRTPVQAQDDVVPAVAQAVVVAVEVLDLPRRFLDAVGDLVEV